MALDLAAYEKKFAQFIKLCESQTDTVVIVESPETIGDNYEEMCESLRRLARKRLSLAIADDSL